jgi:hypothetical protein
MARIDELDILIRHKSSKVVASIPQLGLYAAGQDVGSALSSLENKKKALLEDLKAADISDEFEQVPWTAGPPGARIVAQSGSLWHFALKTLIVVVIVSAALLIPAGLLADKIRNDFRGLSIGGRGFWTKLESELSRAADPSSGLSEEKKKKILADLRAVVERLRPYAAELGPLFSDLRGDTSQVHPPRN